ncbi:MAG: DNA mismatch repair protein MutH [Succinivibrio sp.]
MIRTIKNQSVVKSPESFEELIENLNLITGKSVTELASMANAAVPISPLHGKGFTGELIESLLGASANNLPIPDFPNLGLELKTLPVDNDLVPLESTFFCHAPLTNIRKLTFENSALFHKVQRILFVLINANREDDFSKRFIKGYFFYAPDHNEMATIKNDFDELYEMIRVGNVDKINARFGKIMQLRPKAANGKALTDCVGPDGSMIKTRPRGFYMRRSFTKELVERYLKK